MCTPASCISLDKLEFPTSSAHCIPADANAVLLALHQHVEHWCLDVNVLNSVLIIEKEQVPIFSVLIKLQQV